MCSAYVEAEDEAYASVAPVVEARHFEDALKSSRRSACRSSHFQPHDDTEAIGTSGDIDQAGVPQAPTATEVAAPGDEQQQQCVRQAASAPTAAVRELKTRTGSQAQYIVALESALHSAGVELPAHPSELATVL